MKQYLVFPEHLQALGLVSVLWSNFDAQLLAAIIRLDLADPGIRNDFRRLPSGQRRHHLVQQLIADAKMKDRHSIDVLEDFHALIAKGSHLWSEERNYIAHGQYGVASDSDGEPYLTWWDLASRDTDASDGERIPVEDLTDHAAKVADLIDQIKALSDPRVAALTHRWTIPL